MDVNAQPPEKMHYTSGGDLEIVNIWKTIQGEGPFAGTPAIFIRLAGCNIQCPACDTNYTEGRRTLTVENIIRQIDHVRDNDRIPLIVISGGEPFRQNIRPLCSALQPRFVIQIETNGIFCPVDFAQWRNLVTVVCSPKGPSIHKELYPHITALKYVLQEGQIASDGLPITTLGRSVGVARPDWMKYHLNRTPEIFVQPLDEQDEARNKKNLEATLAVCFSKGYRLCLQTHKMIGLD